MSIIQKHKGLFIGILFLLISIALTFTIVIPIVISYPGLFLQILIEEIADYFLDGKALYIFSGMTMLILFLSVTLLLVKLCKTIIQKNITQGKSISYLQLSLLMLLILIPIQNLGFFILWSFSSFKPDAQIVFNTIASFPLTGILFIPIGIYFDYQLNQKIQIS